MEPMYNFRTKGGDEVKAAIRSIGDEGEAMQQRLAQAAARSAADIEKSEARLAQQRAKDATIQAKRAALTDGGMAGLQMIEQQQRADAASLQLLAAHAAESAKLEARATALRSAIDPLFAAQQRYDAEIRNANELLAAGAIKQEVHSAAVLASEGALAAAKKALDGHSNSLSFNRTQALIAEGATHRFVDSILAGASPMRAFMMQAGDVGNVLAMDDKGVAGGLQKVLALVTPTNAAIAGSVAVLAFAASAWESYEGQIDHFTTLAMGSGRVLGENGRQLEANAEAAASAGRITVGAARDIEAGYLGVARSSDVLVGLTALTEDFAKATGTDAKVAQQELVKSFTDLIAGAEQMAAKYGTMTQAEVDYISKLVEEGNVTSAQIELLHNLQGAFDGAADHADVLAQGWKNIENAASGAWTWMGKALDRMATGGSLQDQLASLIQQRDHPTVNPRFPDTDRADLEQKIADLRYQIRQEAAASAEVKSNAAQAQAAKLVNQYTGQDKKASYASSIATLRAGLATEMPPADRAAETEALLAFTHAYDTLIPKQQKANELAAIDAKIAAAKSPAAKAALAAEREQIESKGEVITAENVLALAHAKADAAAAHATHTNSAHALSLARQAASMEVDTRATLELARAYLSGGDAAIKAEASRKGLTEATRKGIDGDAQSARELAKMVADQIKNGAEAVAQLRDETKAREDVLDKVKAGTLSAKDMNQALSDEAALRPLLKLQKSADAEALKVLIDEIEQYKKGLVAAHEAEAKMFATTAIDEAKDHIAELNAQIADMGKDAATQAINAADREAARQAKQHQLDGPKLKEFTDTKHDEAETGVLANQAKYFSDQKRSMQDSIQLSTAELGLIHSSANVREDTLNKLKLTLQIEEQFPKATQDQIDAAIKLQGELDDINARVREQQALWDDLKQTGEQALDDIFNPDNWNNFGDLGKKVLHDLEMEFIKLAALNPLKNILFGDNLPTLSGGGGSGGGLLSKIFGSILGGGGGGTDGVWDELPGFASGTDYAPGGLAWIAENGPELINLPPGATVSNVSKTRSYLDERAGPASVALKPTYNFYGGTSADREEFKREMAERDKRLYADVVQIVGDARARRILR